MEQECASRIWNRSVAKYKLRYTTMLSDGDSKSHDFISQQKVYWQHVEIKKEECVNHLSKIMGTGLMNVIEQCKAQKDPISGKGKLTKAKVLKIQNYYARAIKDNAGDIATTKKRVFAILFHMTSNDSNPNMFIVHLEKNHGASGKEQLPKMKPRKDTKTIKPFQLMLAENWFPSSHALQMRSY